MAQSDEEIIEEATEAYQHAQESERDNRALFKEDIRFSLLNEQWPEEIQKARENDGRPCLTINKVGTHVRQVVNDARQNKPAIYCHPVDSGADPDTAEVLNGLIRNIEQSSEAEVAYDTALECSVAGGFGYFRINTAYTSDEGFEQDICIEAIPDPLVVYGDPYSKDADSANWDTCFVTDLIERKAFERQYKGAQKVDWAAGEYSTLKEPWCEGEQVVVAEYWRRHEAVRQIVALSGPDFLAGSPEAIAALEQLADTSILDAEVYASNKALFDAAGMTVLGQRQVRAKSVVQYLMTGAEVLETIEWPGKYIPIVPVYGRVINLEGKRHLRSMIHNAKDPSRMHNYWRTMATELVALAPKAPFIGPVGFAKTDAARWETANTENHAFLEYDGQIPPQRQPFAGIPAGALQEALNSADDIKATLGMFDASLGARSNETSGKAIIARQVEGDTANFDYIDNLSRAIRHAGRIIVDLIPRVYSVPRVLRVLGPDGDPQMVQVNQEFPETPKGQTAAIMRIYDLRTGRYDVTVKAGPSFTSRRQEAASQMIELIRAYPNAAPIIGDLLAKNLDWPGADEIAERLKMLLPPQVQGQEGPSPEMQQMQAALAQYSQALQALQQKYDALFQDRANEARKLDIEALKAETDRMEAVNRQRSDLFQGIPSHAA